MTEPVTMETALKLRGQDCPLPALAGPAIKLLFERIEFLEDAMRAAAATLEGDADEHGVAAAMRTAIGKRAAGGLLDGAEHNAYPEVARA